MTRQPLPTSLDEFMMVGNFAQYTNLVREAGCVEIDDIRELDDDDMAKIGMNQTERNRLCQILEADVGVSI